MHQSNSTNEVLYRRHVPLLFWTPQRCVLRGIVAASGLPEHVFLLCDAVQPASGGYYSASGLTAAVAGRDADWSTHSAPEGAGWASNAPAVSQPQPTYRCAASDDMPGR